MPYARRRERLMEQCRGGAVLVRAAGAGDAGVNPNFLYLTGLAEPRACLLLAADGVRIGTGRLHPGPGYVSGRVVRQVLFLPPRDPMAERWGEEGQANLDSVTADQMGVEALVSCGEQTAVLAQCLARVPRLHVVRGYPAVLQGEDDPDSVFLATVQRRFFQVDLEDATPLVEEMRRLKEPDEIRAIERAVGVVAEALDHLMRTVRPGMFEYELEAEITRIYRAHGGIHAFDPIVASGPNALSLHYTENKGPIEAGQLLLVDTGVSINGYKADITRTVPVDGKFMPRQREVYEAVLRALEQTVAECRPGALLGDLHARAYRTMEDAGFAEHFVHGIGHHLGLETHDVGDVHRPLAPGAVITVEPGAYVGAEGIGVRIEDDVAVGDDGYRVLSEAIPRSVEAIEQAMAER